MPDTRLLAFHLPQFHPTPDNDAWWGKGFTEWTNVAKAKPLFPGHYQPHLPADLGFYDLRLPEARVAQAALAEAYGIHGFCYWHYWFNGKRLIERPVNEILSSGEPDFPFCLAWANETWSRRWTGEEQEILVKQDYGGEADALSHFRWLLVAFRDPRYIRVDDKPLFLLYRPQDVPDLPRLTDLWRREAEREGLPGLHLCGVQTSFAGATDPTSLGLDAAVVFQPQSLARHIERSALSQHLEQWAARSVPFRRLSRPVRQRLRAGVATIDYKRAVDLMTADDGTTDYRRYRTVLVGWDNTARRGARGTVMTNGSPEVYGQWLEREITRAQTEPAEHRLVFINAWNEWAEGNHLEPDQKFGLRFLEETKRALISADGSPMRHSIR